MEHARAVIIGGGVGGTSIAYHLAERGWTDIVLVDRAELTSGSTFHSAGLVGQLRSSVTLTKMMMYGADLYRRLAAETGTDPSWHEVGSLRLASSPERYEELRRQAGWAKTFGLPLELISAGEAQDRFPLMSTDGVLGAVWLPTDGWLDPSGLANALAAGARQRGAQVRPHTRVVAIGTDRGRVTGVTVEHRGERTEIAADVVVNAGGMFAPEIGRMVGVTVPIIPMAHQYLFTEPIEGVHPGLPQLRDPDNLVYFREEVGGLCMGGYERDPAPWSLDGVPPDFNGKLLAPDMERFQSIMEGAIRRVPAMADAGVNRVINGPEGFTPDNEFILGESEVRGFFVAAGFSAHGIAGAGGIGRQMASWIVDGEPELDLWKMDIRRFGPAYRSQGYTLARSIENYATYYDIHYPNEERQSGRPLRMAPTYPILEGLGASFGEKSGWERPNWFDSNAAAGDEGLRPRGWAGEHWSPAIGAEALATRQAAGLFDETSFAKIEIVGPGAVAFLQTMCANDVDVPVGRITYTQLLNTRGGIECDVTVTRVASDRYLFITGTAFGQHDMAWLRRHLPGDGSVLLNDLTSGRVCFALWGPRARDILGVGHARRRVRRRFPVPHRARHHRRFRAGLRVACHLRRGARLGAVRAHGVRGLAVADALGGGRAARDGRRRLSRDRRAADREGLPRLVERHHAGRDAVRGGPRVRGRARQGARVHRARRAGRGEGRRSPEAAALPRPRRPALGLPRQRARPGRWRDRRAGDVRRLRLRGRALDRVCVPAAGPGGDRDARRGRGLRRLDRLRGRPRAALRPRRCEDQGMTDDADERGGAPRGLAAPSPWPVATQPMPSRSSTSGATSSSRPSPTARSSRRPTPPSSARSAA